jgi:hypothetical protein
MMSVLRKPNYSAIMSAHHEIEAGGAECCPRYQLVDPIVRQIVGAPYQAVDVVLLLSHHRQLVR